MSQTNQPEVSDLQPTEAGERYDLDTELRRCVHVLANTPERVLEALNRLALKAEAAGDYRTAITAVVKSGELASVGAFDRGGSADGGVGAALDALMRSGARVVIEPGEATGSDRIDEGRPEVH